MAETREVYPDGSIPRLPELAYAGYQSKRKSMILDAHVHDAFEIVYLERGRVYWQESNGTIFGVRGQEMSLTPPGLVHSAAGEKLHPSRFYWINVRLPQSGKIGGRTVLELPISEARTLCQAFSRITRRTCGVSPAVVFGFEALLELLRSPRPLPLQTTAARALLTGLLVEVLRCFETPARDGDVSPLIAEAMRRLTADPLEQPRIHEVARALHVSASYLNRQFKQQCGLTPKDYVVRARVELAKKLLTTTPRSLTEIAIQTGFGNSQYFSACFRRVEGLNPKAYRQQMHRAVQRG